MSCCNTCGPPVYATGKGGHPLGHPDNSPLGLQQFAMEGHEGRRVCEQWDWKHLDVGQDRSYGILQDGSLWGWGKAPLGDGTLNDSDCPVRIHDGPWKMVRDGYAIKEDDKSLWLISGQTGLEPRGELRNAGANAFLSSKIASVTVTNGGNYTVPPDVRTEITGVNQEIGHTIGTQASLKAVLSLEVYEITVTSGGSGYATPPAVWLQNEKGQKAECEAIVKNGSVVGVIALSRDRWEFIFGDTAADVLPAVRFAGDGGATATAKLSGPVVRIDVVSGGDGYTTVPTVVIDRDEGDEANPNAPGAQAVAVASLSPSQVDRIELDRRGLLYNQNQYPAEKVGRILSEHYQSIDPSPKWWVGFNFFPRDFFDGTIKIPWNDGEVEFPWKYGITDLEFVLTGDGDGAMFVANKTETQVQEDRGPLFPRITGTRTTYSLAVEGSGSGWKFPPHAKFSYTSFSPGWTGTPSGPVVDLGEKSVTDIFLPALEIDGPPSEWLHTPSVVVDGDTTAHVEMVATTGGIRRVSRIIVDTSSPIYTTPPEVRISHYTLSPTPLSDFCQEFSGKEWKDVRASRSTAATAWRGIIHGCDADGGRAIEEGTGHIWHWGEAAYRISRSVYPHPFGGAVKIGEKSSAEVPPPALGFSRHAGILEFNGNMGQLVFNDFNSAIVGEPQACGYLVEPDGFLFEDPICFDRFCGSGQGGTGIAAITLDGVLYGVLSTGGVFEWEYSIARNSGSSYCWKINQDGPPLDLVAHAPWIITSTYAQNGHRLCRSVDGEWYKQPVFATALERTENLDEPFADVVSVADTVCRRTDGRLTTAFATDFPQYHIGGIDAKMTNTGEGYTLPAAPSLPNQHPDVVSASVKPDQMTGSVYAVCVIDGGSGYEETPVVEVEGNASVTCAILGPVVEVTVTNGGSGYLTPPKVTFSGAGIPAIARCILNSGGSVASVVVEYGGEYRVKPAVVIEGNATATCRISGSIIYAEVVEPGSGYTSTPAVTVPGNARLAARVLYDYESPDFDRNPPTKLWPQYGVGNLMRLPSTLSYIGQCKSPSGNSASIDSGVCFRANASRGSDGSYNDIESIEPQDPIKFYSQPSVVLGGNTFLLPTTELAVAGVAFSRPYKNEFFAGSKGRTLYRQISLSNSRRRQSPRFAWDVTLNLPDSPPDEDIPLDFVMKGQFVNTDGTAFNHAAVLSQISATKSKIRDMSFRGEPTARLVDHTGFGLTATGVLDADGRLTSWTVSGAPSETVFTSRFQWEFALPARRRVPPRAAVAIAMTDENGSVTSIAISDRGEYSKYDADPKVSIEGNGQGATAAVVMAQPISSASLSWWTPSWTVEGIVIVGGSPVIDAQIAYPQQYPYFQMNVANGGLYRSKPRVFIYGSGRVEELLVSMGNKSVASVEVKSGGAGYANAAVSIMPEEQPAETVSYVGIDTSFQYQTLVMDNWDVEYVKFNKPSSPIWRSILNPDSIVARNIGDTQWSDRCLFVFYESGHVSEVRICNDTSGLASFRTTWDQFPPPPQILELTGDAAKNATVEITHPAWSECYSEKDFQLIDYRSGSDGALFSDRRCVAAKRAT